MSFEQRDNSGSLFKNDRTSGPNSPGYGGTCMVDGREFYISAWVKDGKKGKFFSLAFKPKEQRREERPPLRQEMDDEIPF